MLNQVYNMLFGNSPPTTRSERIASLAFNSKKRPADAIESREESNGDEESPARKRGRPLLKITQPMKQNAPAVSTSKRGSAGGGTSESEQSESEPEQRTRRTTRSTPAQHTSSDSGNSTDNGSDYDCSEDGSEDERPHRKHNNAEHTNVRRSSRTVVVAAQNQSNTSTTKTPQPVSSRQYQTADRSIIHRSLSEPSLQHSGSGAFAAYLTSAQMRRSRRSRNVDLTKELVVMLPGDDPREVPQLDLRGDIEWEEFLIAMAEDTTYLNSDNEESGAAEHLPQSNSTYSLSGLAATAPGHNSLTSSSRLWSNAVTVEAPVRSRTSSGTKDAQQAQYHDILAVNNAAVANEVYVPEVKETPLFKVINVITLLDEMPTKGVSVSSKGKKTKEQDTQALAEQLLVDKKAGGYDCEVHMLPNKMCNNTEMYVDYDADSDDEQFVKDLQHKLDHPTGKAAKQSATAESAGEAVLKVRCFELMIARLEREFELSRLFSVQQSLGGNVPSGESSKQVSKAAAVDTKVNTAASSSSSSKPAYPASTGSNKAKILTQLNLALENAEVMYIHTKRFIKQQNKAAPIMSNSKAPLVKEGHSSKTSPPSSAPPRFTRNGNVANVPISKDIDASKTLNYTSLEKLSHLLALRQSLGAAAAASLPSSTSTANLQELSASSSSNTTTSARPVGRPPTHPRPPQSIIRSKSESSKYQQPDDQSEDSDAGPEEYFTAEQIADMLPQPSTVALLQNVLRNFCAQYSGVAAPPVSTPPCTTSKTIKTGKIGRPPKVRTSSADADLLVAPVSPFGEAKEAIIAREVYQYWQKKRTFASTSLIRAYHNYMMDLWTRADNVALPVPSDYLRGSLNESHKHLLSVRRALDRARLITDRVRRRERLKRDLLRLSGEQYDLLRTELESSLVTPKTQESTSTKNKTSPVADKSKSAAAVAVPVAAPLNPSGQGRDRTGKFLTAKQSMALLGREYAPADKKTGSSKKAAVPAIASSSVSKSVRNQQISFSVPPDSDEEDEDFGATNEADFSSCGSESESEASTVAVAVKSEPQASTPRSSKTQDKGSGSSVNSTITSAVNGTSKRRRADSRSDAEDRPEPSPAASINSTRSNRSTRSAHSLLSTDSGKKCTKSKRSRMTNDRKLDLSRAEDDWLEDSDDDEPVSHSKTSKLTKGNDANHSKYNMKTGAPPTVTPSRSGGGHLMLSGARSGGVAVTSATRTNNVGSASSGGSSAQRGKSRTRNSVPDCSLRNLPFSVQSSAHKGSSTSKLAFDSSHKKRKL